MVVSSDAVADAPGSGFEKGKKNTELQGHVAFFDKDGDGIIWPSDTYTACREIRFNIFMAVLSTVIIHSGLSYFTWGTLLPDPFFRLRVKRMHRAIHGSDTRVYDLLGQFDNNRFDDLFKMYTAEPHTHMTFNEMVRMLHGNLNPLDPFGWLSGAFEWMATYILLFGLDPKGMSKEHVQAVYDGSIFWEISGQKPPYQ